MTKLWARALVVASLIAAPASAQWLQYRTAGVPRDARGKPNLSAPAPRAADGRPDLSGVWTLGTSCPPEGCVDYPVARDDLVGVQQQQCQQRTLLGPAQR